MADGLSQVQDCVSELANHMCNSIGVLQNNAPSAPFSNQPNQSLEDEQETVLFAQLVARTCKDIELVLDALPAADNDLHKHALTLQALHTQNKGGSSVSAVCAAVRVLEDCAQFNAGRGAVLSRDGVIECDAGLMCGHTGAVGAVSCVQGPANCSVQNPISCAQLVLTQTSHALLNGPAAATLARSNGLAMQPAAYFETELRRNQLNLVLDNQSTEGVVVPVQDYSTPAAPKADYSSQGTVGAVALDSHGHLATGSSTGGLCGKMTGRISDSSVCGSGFWADSQLALSGTGNGDNFLRSAACRYAADMVHLQGVSLSTACERVVQGVLAKTTAWPHLGKRSFIHLQFLRVIGDFVPDSVALLLIDIDQRD